MPDYCATTDLTKVFTDIGNYDRKLQLPRHDWTVHSGDVDKLQNPGYMGVLFRDGVSLGAMQAALEDLDTDGEWYYKASTGEETLYCYNSNDADSYTWQAAPTDWSVAQSNAITKASERLEELLDKRLPRPIPASTRSGASGTYDWSITKATALLACVDLVEASNPADPILEQLRSQLYDPDTGLITLINSGKARLSFEWTRSDGGVLEEGTIDSSTTGRPVEPIGTPSVRYNKYKVKIGTGGTLTAGSDNTTITYAVTDIEGQSVVDTTVIDQAGFQSGGGGISIRWLPGDYVANDFWWLTVQGAAPDTSTVHSVRLAR